MNFQPTEEQQNALLCYRTGNDLVIDAAAGAGKTSTLRMIAAYQSPVRPNRRGYYLAFNRSIVLEAQQKFAGTNVQALTMHSLALRSVPGFFRDKLSRDRGSRFIPWGVVAKRAGIMDSFTVPADQVVTTKKITREQLTRMARDTVNTFMRSADMELTIDHVRVPMAIVVKEQTLEEIKAEVLTYAKTIWNDYITPDGSLKLEHDAYLKFWQLSRPQLPVDYVMMDEAQDADNLMTAVMLDQQRQKILVGDEAQMIYSWRGSLNAMNMLPHANRAQLSMSFRFGHDIAREAQFWLDLLDSPMQIKGNPNVSSSVTDKMSGVPDAVLCRSNAGAISEVMHLLKKGRMKVGIAGERKADELKRLAKAAGELQERGTTRHPDFSVFGSWDELVDYATNEDDQELLRFVSLVDRFGADEIQDAIESCSMDDADMVISTAHIAKGLEWGRVRIGEDFPGPSTNEDTGALELYAEEARLAYVAVTRAKHQVSRGSLGWIHDTGHVTLT